MVTTIKIRHCIATHIPTIISGCSCIKKTLKKQALGDKSFENKYEAKE